MLQVRASDNGTETAKDIVHVKSHINIKYFEVPTSDDPVLTWVEVQRGTFPYVSKFYSIYYIFYMLRNEI